MESHRPPVDHFFGVEGRRPCTRERKPSSANFSARVTPDLQAWRLAVTSCVFEPIEDTMPIPVTTTRLI